MTERAVEQQGSGEQRSLGDIVSSITTDLSTLIRQEMDLAKTELKEEVGKAGKEMVPDPGRHDHDY